MSPNPCLSNDAIGLMMTNESNDSGLGIQQRQGNGNPKGSGCNEMFMTAALEETEPEIEIEDDTETEDETEPEDLPAPASAQLADFISCNSANADELSSSGNFEYINLMYDYEMHTVEDADLESSVKAFEFDLLQAVADKYNLSECEFGRRSLLRNGRALSGSEVVGVGSYPGDQQDSIHTECQVALDIDSNDTLDLMEESSCTPINGQMTAWVNTSGRRHLSEDDLYKAIEDYSKSYTNDRVLAVSYIGTRPDDIVQANVPFIDKATKDDGNTDNLVASSSAMAPGAIAGIAVGSALAILALLALVVTKKRKDRRNANNNEQSRKIVNDALFMTDVEDDLEQVGDDASKSSVETEDHTFDNTLLSNATLESDSPSADEAGFEIQI